MGKKDKQVSEQSQSVHVMRPSSPEALVIDEVTKLKHERSVQAFPELNLSDGEYIISAVRRHPIGLLAPFSIAIFLVTLTFIALFNYQYLAETIKSDGDAIDPAVVVLPAILFIALVILITYAAYYIYTNNKFFLTNESVIQEIQTGLFSKYEQTVSLLDIEDASFIQDNILEQLFDFGSIRLSTEGDETTYRFTFVASPKQHIATLTNAVEAFKSGRPVEDS